MKQTGESLGTDTDTGREYAGKADDDKLLFYELPPPELGAGTYKLNAGQMMQEAVVGEAKICRTV